MYTDRPARVGPCVHACVTVSLGFPRDRILAIDRDMPSQGALRQGRDILAGLYPRLRTARRVVSDAKLKEERIDWGGAALDVWHEIILESVNAGRFWKLLRVAHQEYPRHAGLRALFKKTMAV